MRDKQTLSCCQFQIAIYFFRFRYHVRFRYFFFVFFVFFNENHKSELQAFIIFDLVGPLIPH